MKDDFYILTNFSSIALEQDYSVEPQLGEEPPMILKLKSSGCGCCSNEKRVTKRMAIETVKIQINELQDFLAKLEAL